MYFVGSFTAGLFLSQRNSCGCYLEYSVSSLSGAVSADAVASRGRDLGIYRSRNITGVQPFQNFARNCESKTFLIRVGAFSQGTQQLCFPGLHQTAAKRNVFTGLCSEDEA